MKGRRKAWHGSNSHHPVLREHKEKAEALVISHLILFSTSNVSKHSLLHYLIWSDNPESRSWYHPHWTDKETEAPRLEVKCFVQSNTRPRASLHSGMAATYQANLQMSSFVPAVRKWQSWARDPGLLAPHLGLSLRQLSLPSFPIQVLCFRSALLTRTGTMAMLTQRKDTLSQPHSRVCSQALRSLHAAKWEIGQGRDFQYSSIQGVQNKQNVLTMKAGPRKKGRVVLPLSRPTCTF